MKNNGGSRSSMASKNEKRSFFERPLFLKILSVFLAVILWFFVAGGDRDALGLEVVRSFDNIPLSIRNLGEDLVVVEKVDEVKIYLQGMQAAFDGLTPADLEAYVDLQGCQEGWHEIRINATAPPGVSVVRIEPARANFLLDNLVSRQMEIEKNYQGEPAEGRVITQSNFEPDYVFVQGPGRKVDQVERVVFMLDLEGAEEDIVAQSVSLFPVDKGFKHVEGLTVVPDTAEVWVRFALPSREFPVEAVFVPEEVEVELLSIEPQKIQLRGPKELLESYDSIVTEDIDLAALSEEEGRITLDASLIIPDGLEVIEQDSVRVRFILAEYNNESR